MIGETTEEDGKGSRIRYLGTLFHLGMFRQLLPKTLPFLEANAGAYFVVELHGAIYSTLA